MEIYWILCAAFCAALLFFVSIVIPKEKKPDVFKNEDVCEVEHECDDETVRQTIIRAYRSLEKQKAAGYGPWLSACLSRRDTPPGVALEALRRVQSELRGFSGRRYDLKELGRAILALEVEMGEWG